MRDIQRERDGFTNMVIGCALTSGGVMMVTQRTSCGMAEQQDDLLRKLNTASPYNGAVR